MAYKIFSRLLILAAFCSVVGVVAMAADVQVPCIADNVFCGHSSEHNLNCGGRSLLRLKGYQGILGFKFDMSKVAGAKVDGGTFKVFCVRMSGTAKPPLTINVKISTIGHDWVEGNGNYTEVKGASTYDYPSGPNGPLGKWADRDYNGQGRHGLMINVEDAVNGNNGSILNSEFDVMTFDVGKWTNEIELRAELVQALVDGKAYGIALWQSDVSKNIDIASKEEAGGAHAAVLIVHTSKLSVEPDGKLASMWGDLKDRR